MRILLNTVKSDNFVFFDPDNKIHLNRKNPIGEVAQLTPSLKRALISNTVIDIDDNFNIQISDENRMVNDMLLKFMRIIRHKKDSSPTIETHEVEAIIETPIEEDTEAAIEETPVVVETPVEEAPKKEVETKEKKDTEKPKTRRRTQGKK